MNALWQAFNQNSQETPDEVCFTAVDNQEAGAAPIHTQYTYAAVEAAVRSLVAALRRRGVRRGALVSVDLANCSLYVLLVLAAARGGFTLVVLNHRQAAPEKELRLADIEQSSAPVVLHISEENAAELLEEVRVAVSPALVSGGSTSQPDASVGGSASTPCASGDAHVGSEPVDSERDDPVDPADPANSTDPAVILFTSGTTGRPKAVPLTWENLCGAAAAANRALDAPGTGRWQAVLPLFHVGGLQVVVRSILAGNPFLLYRRFNSDDVLRDARAWGATHIPVVDKMLQDILASSLSEAVACYRCILLGGGALNMSTLRRARARGARVYASYGMTETASNIANCLVDDEFDGGLALLDGYEARIVDGEPAHDAGAGALAVSGPGVFGGYLNAATPRTTDGLFCTGDTAELRNGRLYLHERVSDMFVSGGENVYPAEVEACIRALPHVTDAYVFGVPHAVWGRRPVAMVEADPRVVRPAAVRAALSSQVSKVSLPDQVFIMASFPRIGIGKIDRAALRRRYNQRIEVRRVTLHRISLPFVSPVHTAKATLDVRESVIVEVEDREGRIGLGECVAFPTDWYLPETLDDDLRVLRNVLAPLLLEAPLLHPSEATDRFARSKDAVAHPLACGSIEPALWDLYGKIVEAPLWELIGGRADSAGPTCTTRAGAVVGIGTPEQTVAAVRRCVQEGYARVKLKVAPGSVQAVQAVRRTFPQLTLSLDANQSFTEAERAGLRALDECGARWIEEPLRPAPLPVGQAADPSAKATQRDDLLGRLAALQRDMHTPVCLDESLTNGADVQHALSFPALTCYALKIAKLGGVQPALNFVQEARNRGITVWMGGMYDTGISKRLHAAFQTLPGVADAGDLGATARYFATDVTEPPYAAPAGVITLNAPGHEYGLGCGLNRAALESVRTECVVIG